jgi:hypothetical protein
MAVACLGLVGSAVGSGTSLTVPITVTVPRSDPITGASMILISLLYNVTNNPLPVASDDTVTDPFYGTGLFSTGKNQYPTTNAPAYIASAGFRAATQRWALILNPLTAGSNNVVITCSASSSYLAASVVGFTGCRVDNSGIPGPYPLASWVVPAFPGTAYQPWANNTGSLWNAYVGTLSGGSFIGNGATGNFPFSYGGGTWQTFTLHDGELLVMSWLDVNEVDSDPITGWTNWTNGSITQQGFVAESAGQNAYSVGTLPYVAPLTSTTGSVVLSGNFTATGTGLDNPIGAVLGLVGGVGPFIPTGATSDVTLV